MLCYIAGAECKVIRQEEVKVYSGNRPFYSSVLRYLANLRLGDLSFFAAERNFPAEKKKKGTWPVDASEAESDLTLIQTSLLFSFECK